MLPVLPMIIKLLIIPHGMQNSISVFQSCTVIAHSPPSGPAWIPGCFLSDLQSFMKSQVAQHGFQMKVPLYWRKFIIYCITPQGNKKVLLVFFFVLVWIFCGVFGRVFVCFWEIFFLNLLSWGWFCLFVCFW